MYRGDGQLGEGALLRRWNWGSGRWKANLSTKCTVIACCEGKRPASVGLTHALWHRQTHLDLRKLPTQVGTKCVCVCVCVRVCMCVYVYIYIYIYIKVKWCTLVQALRLFTSRTAHSGSRGIALPFHDRGTRRWWGVSVTSRTLLPLRKTRYPLYRRLGGPQGQSGQVQKISPPPGFDPRTVQPVASCYTNWATWPTKLWDDAALKNFFFCLRNCTESVLSIKSPPPNPPANLFKTIFSVIDI